MRTVLITASAVIAFACPAFGHGAAKWIEDGGYRNAADQKYCGERDCAELPTEDVAVSKAATSSRASKSSSRTPRQRHRPMATTGAVRGRHRPTASASSSPTEYLTRSARWRLCAIPGSTSSLQNACPARVACECSPRISPTKPERTPRRRGDTKARPRDRRDT
jgi:hypothetical protein